MIDASELRIGNKFYMGGGTMIQTVFEIIDNTDRNRIAFQSQEHWAKYHKLITCEENLNQYKPIEIEGIPLTPELLKNWCYEINVDIEYGFKQYTGKLARATKDSDWWRLYSRWGHTIGDTIQYVHQLQNLYFALTRTELTFNPKP